MNGTGSVRFCFGNPSFRDIDITCCVFPEKPHLVPGLGGLLSFDTNLLTMEIKPIIQGFKGKQLLEHNPHEAVQLIQSPGPDLNQATGHTLVEVQHLGQMAVRLRFRNLCKQIVPDILKTFIDWD
jgi:hypothetical protein